MAQQPTLRIYSCGVPGQRALRPHNPVTRHDDRNRILTDCRSYRLVSLWNSHRLGQFAVSDRRPVGNAEYPVPSLALKRSAAQIQPHLETCPLAVEVFIDLAYAVEIRLGMRSNITRFMEPVQSHEEMFARFVRDAEPANSRACGRHIRGAKRGCKRSPVNQVFRRSE